MAANAQTQPRLAWIDHLILGSASLDAGVETFRERTGVEPVRGGEHPGVGTHNALASLGGDSYLEILAPIPGAKIHEGWRELATLQGLSPVGWAAGVRDMERAREALRQAGFETTDPTAGSRALPDGVRLEWQVSFIREPQTLLAPFLIEWKDLGKHPSATSPAGCRLTALKLGAPDISGLARLIRALQLDAPADAAREAGMTVALDCPAGPTVFETQRL